jgi:ATP-dependent DNA helicase RecQ
MPTYDAARALELLRIGAGRADAEFRDGQEDAIRHVVEGRGRLLVVQKTGWGKSFVYFIATKLLREAGGGPALLVSPLLSLMRNQIAAAERMGVRAATINSTNPNEWRSVARQVVDGKVDILLISPERLANEEFRQDVLNSVAPTLSLLVIDEAHCISDWGHDFRPHYRLIERTATTLPPNARLLATTATANDRVMQDLRTILGRDLHVSRGGLARPSLTLQTIRLPDQASRLAWLADTVPRLPGSGIIYTLTVADADMVNRFLVSKGIRTFAYHAGFEPGERVRREEMLLANEVKALVATTALGMGYDKPDLSFVIHYQMPGSVVHYYQQVGRAGRAIESARGVLLSGEEETRINDWFIKSAFPKRADVEAIIECLDRAGDGLSLPNIAAKVNIRHSQIEKALTLLSLERPAPVVKEGSKWQLTAAPLQEAFWERATRLTTLRREEEAQMRTYVALPFGEHMRHLIRALDGDDAGIAAPTLQPLSAEVTEEAVREAADFLRRTELPFDPRKQWSNLQRIPASSQANAGRALCTWRDAGWGDEVFRGKYADDRFSDRLVEASAAMIRKWSPAPAPAWVTCVPSNRRPTLVADFARRLAQALQLPFHAALVKIRDTPEQKEMQNSPKQEANVRGSFGVDAGAVRPGPVLLVDDVVDSRWTMTVAAAVLREHGAGEVWPMALALAGSDE